MPPAPRQGQSTQVQPKKGWARERLWTTVLFVTIASLPALLVGCTLAFPSIALLDLSELEEREHFKLSTLLSDVFGVSVQWTRSMHASNHHIMTMCFWTETNLSRGVTPIGAVSRAATGVKIFDRLKMALTA